MFPGTDGLGLIGAAWRIARRIPPHIWVINEHIEPITVVVSKDRPCRLLSGVGLNISMAGAGLSYETTTYTPPAIQKTLAPQTLGEEPAKVIFPLWTQNENYGIISIFTGSDPTLYIENDRVPLGATVVFQNKPNLKTVMC
ncbi:hypothetical protein BDV29DRAFT_188538 [Aspergillus leporis]|uniref:Uncharacterized protein n=1 Tax=Aspergillus leporis TaxID=41062 RepID=A0A5N5XDR9_9EURO|nr:hypothetical protein BDV29DRAFT_188538 [Aspergillus leporis]